MNRVARLVGHAFLIVLLLLGTVLSPAAVRAGEGGADDRAGSVQVAEREYREPGAAGMIVDGLLVRPLGVVATVIGVVVFIATVPFSAMGGNIGDAADALVVTPAAYTFVRCLGCWRR